MITSSRNVYIAAAVIGLLAVVLPLLLLNRDSQGANGPGDQLFSDHLTLPPAPEARDEVMDPWREAYMAGDYPRAIEVLQERLADSTYRYRSEAHLYMGLSHLAIEEPVKALESLEQVSASSFYFADARWCRVQALLRLDRAQEARRVVENILEEPRHPHREEAEALLEKWSGLIFRLKIQKRTKITPCLT